LGGWVEGPFFVVRSPLRPIDDVLSWTATGSEQSQREWLSAHLDRAEVQEALEIASPSLARELPIWRAAPTSERGAKIEQALVRYVVRASLRATPFGLFAGISTGLVGDALRLSLPPSNQWQRRVVLSGEGAARWVLRWAADPALRPLLEWAPNPTLQPQEDRWHFFAFALDQQDHSQRLAWVERTAYLDQVLLWAEGGATLNALADRLCADDPELERQEAFEYLCALADAQVLQCTLRAPVSVADPLAWIRSRLPPDAPAHLHRQLADLRDHLAVLDSRPLGVSASLYADAAQGLSPSPHRALAVALHKPGASLELSARVVRMVREGLEALRRLSPRFEEDPPLAQFRARFTERYEDGEVPLLEALDAGHGLDPAAGLPPALTHLPLGAAGSEQGPAPVAPAVLLTAFERAAREGRDEVCLKLEDLPERPELPPVPDAFCVRFLLQAAAATRGQQDVDRVVLSRLTGPSGAELLGRFAVLDDGLRQHLEAHLRREEALRPEAIFAEIVHHPGGQANTVTRPSVRPWEIPLLAQSGVSAEHQLLPSDLLVSVRDGRVVLRSRRLGREVIPAMSNAHAWFHSRVFPLYEFLNRLRFQGVHIPTLSWGALQRAAFLPRLVVGRAVLSAARWRLAPEDLKGLKKATAPERRRQLAGLRERLGWPRMVSAGDADRLLACDLDNVLCVDSFAQLLASGQDTVQEMLAVPDSALTGEDGRYVGEYVLPFTRAQRPPVAPRNVPASKRYLPGGRWSYLKIYTGPAPAERLLLEALAPRMEEAVRRGEALRWFFIRYGDPEPHLRLRFEASVPPTALRAELERICEAARARFGVWRVQWDTFIPELSRYGGERAFEHALDVFCADSRFVSAVLGAHDADDLDGRYRLGVLAASRLLEDLGFSRKERVERAAALRAGYLLEAGGGATAEAALSTHARALRGQVEAMLLGAKDTWPEGVWSALEQRSSAVRASGARLRALEAEGALCHPLGRVAESLLHLCLVRLLQAGQRTQELVIYDLLWRAERSLQARYGEGKAAASVG
jgi:lantibiotic biosynthesis protein